MVRMARTIGRVAFGARTALGAPAVCNWRHPQIRQDRTVRRGRYLHHSEGHLDELPKMTDLRSQRVPLLLGQQPNLVVEDELGR